MVSIGTCLACFNRRERTLRCLETLEKLALPHGVQLKIYLVDDNSPDGTGGAVRQRFPEVEILAGDGHLFWGGGMRLAYGTAMAHGHDFYLWLNDDEELSADLIARLLDTHERVSQHGRKPVLVSGSCFDPETGAANYGGRVRLGFNPLDFTLVEPDATEPKQCETMNGNIVLVPDAAARMLGNIDGHFRQQMGDFDYGLRAQRLGIPVWICPGFTGACAANTVKSRWRSAKVPFRQRLKIVNTPLGLPLRDWLAFTARHGGILGVCVGLAAYRHVLFPDPA